MVFTSLINPAITRSNAFLSSAGNASTSLNTGHFCILQGGIGFNHATANGMTVNAVAASRPICANCAVSISDAGAVPASPLKKYSIKQAVDATYVKPPPIILPPKQ